MSIDTYKDICHIFLLTLISGLFSVSRFTDDVDMDVVAVYVVDSSAGLNEYYNCNQTSGPCTIAIFDPANRVLESSKTSVAWEYGTQNFVLRCLPKHNLKLVVLRSIIAWPLLMSMVVLFCSIIVCLVLKRMQSIEKDVAIMEKMNTDLNAAKLAAEAADKAKSNFLATVSHEIRCLLKSNKNNCLLQDCS